ncbi:hypothetical protein G6O69_27070 [Pseudenhygromyxa sp. WMMC2535]|uniref:hypothetical protein n=1 Tax=Pseudenhygromyxa sp. WMMC2535 TaxID=2712867 RepID=UPI0015529FE4|nr:hypothetical protein [Pseudenhygromyxa sp. WMMC2535]NVB41530.1 hypothetical protein [Pseudenhygromyxa sp. WMMC2535]
MLSRPKLPHGTLGLAGILSLALLACSSGESKDVVSAMQKADEDEEKTDSKKEDGKKKTEIPTSELPPPTAEELAAWNRKDPEGEKHLYKWDKKHSKQMQTYWKELRCLRDKMKSEGDKAVGAEPGSPEAENWDQFKRAFIPHVDGWQQRLFAAEGQEILSKSKYISNIIEAHELVMNGYPVAYNDGDEKEIKRQDALWTVAEGKVVSYSDQIGAPMELPDLSNEKEAKKWEKFCDPVLKPPKKKK